MSSKLILDQVLNDSDKPFVVPAGQRYKIRYGQVTLISTATVGNRQMALEIQDDAANVVFRSLAGAVQAESLTREYHFAPNPVRESAFVNGQIMVPIPPDLILLPAWTMRLYDTAAIDAAADDMTVAMMIEDRELIRADVNAG
jgi:hypothetical protein